ncbi:MAG TPA: tetratricopeptide repeat protein [Thermoanaerobaculia bacterium]
MTLVSLWFLVGSLVWGQAFVSAAAGVAAGPEDPLRQAQSLLADGRPDQAAPIFESILAARPGSPVALRGLANSYGILRDPRALETFDRAVAADPNNLPLKVEFAEYLWDTRRFDRGNAEMEGVIQKAPGNAKLRVHYGMNLASQSKFALAAREFDAAHRGGIDNADVLFYLGSALWETGRLDESEKWLREAVQRGPEKAPARHRLGRLLLFRGKSEEAVVELERASAQAPDSAEIALDFGRALEATGKMTEAEAAYRKALSLEPGLSATHYTLGALLARTGRREEAQQHIALYQDYFDKEQKRRFQAGARQAELNLGWTELDAGHAEKALAQFERHPDDPEGLRGAAMALSKLGQHSEAARRLERAVLIDPENRGLRWELDREREKITR